MDQAKKMNDMVAYQAGSVVSKEIVSKPTGTVTLFAFDQGQGLSEHEAPFDALVIVIDGKAEITLAGIKHLVSTGEMLLMPANTKHALKAIQSFKMVLTMIKSP